MPRKASSTTSPIAPANGLSDADGVIKDAPTRSTDAHAFQEAYQRLQDAVHTVRAASVDDLDTLVSSVQQGAAAHKLCKARLQAVRDLLNGLDTPSASDA